MTMKTHKIFILLAGMLFFSVTAMAQPAQGPRSQRPGPGFARGEHMMRMLNLTKEQRSKIMDMRLAMQKEMLPLRNKLITFRGDLKLEMTAEQFNQGKVNKTVDQIADVRKQMSLKRIQHMRNVRNILNPDQQKKFDLMVMNPMKGRFMHNRSMRNWGKRGMQRPNRPMRQGMGPGPGK